MHKITLNINGQRQRSPAFSIKGHINKYFRLYGTRKNLDIIQVLYKKREMAFHNFFNKIQNLKWTLSI